MKKLQFLYNMKLNFSMPAVNHNFKLKCLPQTSAYQTVESLKVEVLPKTELSCGTDAYGNLTRYGSVNQPHEQFDVAVNGVCLVGKVGREPVNPYILGLFKLHTPLTAAGNSIKQFYEEISPLLNGSKDDLEKARAVMNAVYDRFEYTPKITDSATAAEDAFFMKKGVCQDYSQVMLSLCRLAKIPCRYVAGLLMGEGESHAWVEVESGGFWYGFDPTNCIEVIDSHIVISAGRDSSECSINRGVFRGGGTQSQQIYVKVEEI